jgi:hypothetical protein
MKVPIERWKYRVICIRGTRGCFGSSGEHMLKSSNSTVAIEYR